MDVSIFFILVCLVYLLLVNLPLPVENDANPFLHRCASETAFGLTITGHPVKLSKITSSWNRYLYSDPLELHLTAEQDREHDSDEREQIAAARVFAQPFVIPRQSSKSRRPGKRAFGHPTSRHEHKSGFSPAMFDRLKLDAVLCRSGCGILARISLIKKGRRTPDSQECCAYRATFRDAF